MKKIVHCCDNCGVKQEDRDSNKFPYNEGWLDLHNCEIYFGQVGEDDYLLSEIEDKDFCSMECLIKYVKRELEIDMKEEKDTREEKEEKKTREEFEDAGYY